MQEPSETIRQTEQLLGRYSPNCMATCRGKQKCLAQLVHFVEGIMKDIDGKIVKNGDVAILLDNSRRQVMVDTSAGPPIFYHLDKKTGRTIVQISLFPMETATVEVLRPPSPPCYVSRTRRKVSRRKASR